MPDNHSYRNEINRTLWGTYEEIAMSIHYYYLISKREQETKYPYDNLGVKYAKNKEWQRAYEIFKAYERLLPPDRYTYINWTLYYAFKGEKEKALLNLQKAIELGYDDIEWLTTDESMDKLRDTKAFTDLIQKMKKQ